MRALGRELSLFGQLLLVEEFQSPSLRRYRHQTRQEIGHGTHTEVHSWYLHLRLYQSAFPPGPYHQWDCPGASDASSPTAAAAAQAWLLHPCHQGLTH